MLSKSELIRRIADEENMKKVQVEKVVNALFDTLTSELAAGTKIQISGFGSFEKTYREGRVGRNPATGETIDISGKWVTKFKPAKFLEGIINR